MRLTKIYTRQGDQGKTVFAGKRIYKDETILEVIGTLDELNSSIGLILAFGIENTTILEYLTKIQHKLFDLGGELHSPEYKVITQEDVDELERHLDKINDTLPALTEFILPRGNVTAAACHLARTICRRAERNMVTLQRCHSLVNPVWLKYLNRLSDLLFVLARALDEQHINNEVLWQKKNKID